MRGKVFCRLLIWSLILIFSSPDSATAAPFSYIEDDRAYIHSFTPYSYRGMSLKGIGYWDNNQYEFLNPAAIHYMEDYFIFPILNLCYDISTEEVNFHKDIQDRTGSEGITTLTDPELREYNRRRYYTRGFWTPFTIKKNSWFFSTNSSFYREFYPVETGTSIINSDTASSAGIYSYYRNDLGVSVGYGNRVKKWDFLEVSMGYKLNLILSFASDSLKFNPNDNLLEFLNPLPDEIGEMETRLGYSMDFGTGMFIRPLHLHYSLMIEQIMGQLAYTRTRPLYHMALNWRAFLQDNDSPDYNLKLGVELYRLGDLDIDEALHLGSEIQFRNLFIRCGYRSSEISYGCGVMLGNVLIQYAYFPDNPFSDQDSRYRHGLEFYIRK